LLQDRLYINKEWTVREDSVRANHAHQHAACVGDFNGDGHQISFVVQAYAKELSVPDPHYLLRNDVPLHRRPEEIAPELAHPGGMITDAV